MTTILFVTYTLWTLAMESALLTLQPKILSLSKVLKRQNEQTAPLSST